MISLETKPVRVGRSILRFTRGSPLPLGATVIRNGINFAIFSRHATAVSLLLFQPGKHAPLVEIPLDRRFNRTGDIWHGFVHNLDPGIHYAYRVDRGEQTLLDPHARAITGHSSWGAGEKVRRGLVVEDGFDWGADQPLNIPLSETIIYEMHVRGFTRDPSSGVSKPGTFAGLIQKIPYLVNLGITAVELLPVHEFEEVDSNRINPFTGERLLNYWGYQPISFFAPNAAYSSSTQDGGQIDEFKHLVRSLHAAGIEVILDVVFNHTAEGDKRGPTFSFRGIDNTVYYMLDPRTGRYLNYSGCGNTLNCNHPVVRDLIVECLRYWVMEMHVDGFRFDLASILGRGQDGAVLENPPLLESLAHDPVLANTKLIAEAWDAAGLYQVGTFPAWSRWAEWNGKFRDDVRRFVRGEPGMVSALATRLVGSPDLFHTSRREPYHSINFVTCHDGFTLADLVSYDHKHNEMNGENSADGVDYNLSWNCGHEGSAHSDEINRLRSRQIRNFATILLLSDGVPMILGGDEIGRTQSGNNNAYCQDNEISWIDWGLEAGNADLLRFFRKLIEFRRHHPLLRATSFVALREEGRRSMEWHGFRLEQPDWSPESRWLALHLSGLSEEGREEHIYFIANAHWEDHVFELPDRGIRWFRFIDTGRQPPNDIAGPGEEAVLHDSRQYLAGGRSTVVLIGRVLPAS
ncbi:MAG: glycogen debranching protein GlgX [Bryobacteraceae bacterium]